MREAFFAATSAQLEAKASNLTNAAFETFNKPVSCEIELEPFILGTMLDCTYEASCAATNRYSTVGVVSFVIRAPSIGFVTLRRALLAPSIAPADAGLLPVELGKRFLLLAAFAPFGAAIVVNIDHKLR